MPNPYLCVIALEPGPQPMPLDIIANRASMQRIGGCPQLELFAEFPTDVIDLHRGRGVIIGTIFDRSGLTRRRQRLEPDEADLVGGAPASVLCDRYWGGFVALVRRGDTIDIVRDPSGALPCYYARQGPNLFIASNPGLLVDTGLVETSLDYTEIAWQQWSMFLPSGRTALKGIFELRPGFVLSAAAAGLDVKAYWSPWRHVDPQQGRDGSSQEERLRDTTLACVRSWSSCYDHVLLGFSGGLDSSLVAAGLANGLNSVTLMNMVTHEARGDEREFARAGASHLGLPLKEIFYDINDVAVDRSSVAHLPRPSGRTHEQAYDAAVARTAQQTGAVALFTGNGGDNVFFKTRSARPIVDRLRRDGPSAAMSTMGDVRALTGCGAAQALVEAWKVIRSGPRYRWKPQRAFLRDAMVSKCAEIALDHPWLDLPHGALPGKAAHVAMILRMLPHLEGAVLPDAIPTINPLASQPLIELCLSMPTWSMVRGGCDRAAARRAFSNLLPPEIIERRSKGGPDAFAVEVLRVHLASSRERLLDGQLAARELIDRTALEGALNAQRLGIGTEYVRLLALLDCEAWTRTWLERIQRARATSRS